MRAHLREIKMSMNRVALVMSDDDIKKQRKTMRDREGALASVDVSDLSMIFLFIYPFCFISSSHTRI